ncbi:MAG: hypothetical protein HC838_15695 [Spirulinaceae cyanobacterium RM2_2_10]|nr:hypothetical protein [Spirulinaceae cyanobacterium SM2_1_0]NJO21191.1 hypothetical protein [Spirulinaceae cyanobacterium RM2_2_10]
MSDDSTRDPERDQRLEDKVLAGTYTARELASSWYAYLCDHLRQPFQARWSQDDTLVEVVSMADSPECDDAKDMLAYVRYPGSDEEEDDLVASLNALEPIDAPAETVQALGDWRYWTAQGGEIWEGNYWEGNYNDDY